MTRTAGARTLGIDVGGTKIAAGVVDESGRVLTTSAMPTPKDDATALYDAVASLASALIPGNDVGAVGLGVAAFVDTKGVVQFAPHLPWRDEPVQRNLSDRLGLPVLVDNDANVGGWAEARFGAAKDVGDALFVAVGTGIGGALIGGNRLLRGGHGMAGEIGHLPVVTDGRACPCGLRGCWEQYASGRALMRAAAEAGFDVGHGASVTEAAVAGDPAALAVFAEVGRWLGVGMAIAATVLDPAVIVVGGGVSVAGDLLLEPARAAMRAALPGGLERPAPQVVAAALGPAAAVIGAADLARSLR
jgi:glucokinase